MINSEFFFVLKNLYKIKYENTNCVKFTPKMEHVVKLVVYAIPSLRFYLFLIRTFNPQH